MKSHPKSIIQKSLLCALIWGCGVSGAYAEEGITQVVVQQTDPAYPAQRLSAPGITVKPLERKLSSEEQVAPPPVRNHWIHEAGLDDFVAGWDDFAKDQLVIRAEIVEFDVLSEDYPSADARALARLQKIIQKERETK